VIYNETSRKTYNKAMQYTLWEKNGKAQEVT